MKKNAWGWLLIAGFLSLSACKTAPRISESTPDQSATYQHELDKAFAELDRQAPRKPAQVAPTFEFAALNRISPGKFKVFVFPKLRQFASKSNEDAEALFKNEAEEKASRLGRPEEFEVTAVAENPCHQFISGGLFSKLNAKDYFDNSLGKNHAHRCAILEVTSLKMKNANRSLVRRDDLLRTRLYLDDAYRVHGYETEKFIDSQTTQMIRVKAEGAQSATSGLTLFPIDIPQLSLFRSNAVKNATIDIRNKIDTFAVNQIRKKLMGSFIPVSCAGFQANYTDYYGSKVEVGWCEGLPFPQYMENDRFLAITQPLTVR